MCTIFNIRINICSGAYNPKQLFPDQTIMSIFWRLFIYMIIFTLVHKAILVFQCSSYLIKLFFIISPFGVSILTLHHGQMCSMSDRRQLARGSQLGSGVLASETSLTFFFYISVMPLQGYQLHVTQYFQKVLKNILYVVIPKIEYISIRVNAFSLLFYCFNVQLNEFFLFTLFFLIHNYCYLFILPGKFSINFIKFKKKLPLRISFWVDQYYGYYTSSDITIWLLHTFRCVQMCSRPFPTAPSQRVTQSYIN